MSEKSHLLKSLRSLLSMNLLFAGFLFSLQPLQAADGQSLFASKCSGCHTVGGGVLVGPDLAICVKRQASDLAASVKAMEKSAGPLTDDEVTALVKYLQGGASSSSSSSSENQNETLAQATGQGPMALEADDKTTAGNGAAVVAGPKVPTSESLVDKASVDKGRRLFFGEVAFSKGGLSCIACHQSEAGNSLADGGSNLGPDLALIGKKMPYQALVAACEKAPFKIMRTTYEASPLTRQEAQDVAAYLSTLKGEQSAASISSVSVAAALLAASVMLAIAFGYRFRNKSARAKLSRRR